MNETLSMNDTIVVEIDIAAPPEQRVPGVDRPAAAPRVVGRRRRRTASTKLDSDLRVGGKWRTEGKSADGKEFSVFGQYTRVEPPKALAFTWNHRLGRPRYAGDARARRADTDLLGNARDGHPLRIHRRARARRSQPGMAARAGLAALVPAGELTRRCNRFAGARRRVDFFTPRKEPESWRHPLQRTARSAGPN